MSTHTVISKYPNIALFVCLQFGAPCAVILFSVSASWAQFPESTTAAANDQQTPRDLRELVDNNRRDPAVRGLLQRPLETPTQVLQTALLFLELDSPQPARALLDRLMAMNLDDQGRVKLVEQFSTAQLLRLALHRWPVEGEAIPQPWPELRAFIDACLEANASAARAPQRLAQLVDQLDSEADALRRAAVRDLAAAGEEAVVYCIEQLAGEEVEAQRLGLQRALVALQPLSARPLVAALSSRNPRFVADVAQTLGVIGEPRSIPFLAASTMASHGDTQALVYSSLARIVGRTKTSLRTEDLLWKALKQVESGSLKFPVNEDALVRWWTWDDAATRLSSSFVKPAQAQRLRMGELVARGFTAGAQPADVVLRYLPWLAEAVRVRQQLGLAPTNEERIARETAQSLTTDQLSVVLEDTLARGFYGAADYVMQRIAARGDLRALASQGGQPSPLASALRNGQRSVRFAAASTIASLDPQLPYAGSQGFTEVAAEMLLANERPSLLIAMPRLQQAVDMAARLAGLDISPIPVAGGSQAIKEALQRPDLRFAWVDKNLPDLPVREVVYQLRNATRTKHLPTAVLAATGQLPAAKRLADEHTAMLAAPRPHDAVAAQAIFTELVELQAVQSSTGPSAIENAKSALAWLESSAMRSPRLYSLWQLEEALIGCLPSAELSSTASRVLARIGTSSAQEALAAAAHRDGGDSASVSVIKESFAASLARFGDLRDAGDRAPPRGDDLLPPPATTRRDRSHLQPPTSHAATR